jgi:xanthine dehydrogenase accessory factor
MSETYPIVIVRGGGDIATGVAVRLHRAGFAVVVTDVAMPLAVRRLVAFAEAIYEGETLVEEIKACRVNDGGAVKRALSERVVPVIVDPTAEIRHTLPPLALIDGRMVKRPSDLLLDAAPMIIGLGPGFTAGKDCHAVVETNRGHHMGRVFWEGSAQDDTGIPEKVAGHDVDRVLRAPTSGRFEGLQPLASIMAKGTAVGKVGGMPVHAPFTGALRGLLHSGLHVEVGAKVGDLDPRCDPTYCYQISDKSLAVGGGVLEALLSQPQIRARLEA